MTRAVRSRSRKRPQQSVDRQAPDFAIESVVDGMKLEYIQCRDFGHSWRPYTAKATRFGYEEQLRCNRCRGIRTRTLNARGAVMSGNYEYSDGYLIKGLGRLAGAERDYVRLASVKAIATPDTAEDD